MCQVSDIRAGGVPVDRKLLSTLQTKHGNDLEDKSLTICSGTDYININYQHIVCPDAETAKVSVMICILFCRVSTKKTKQTKAKTLCFFSVCRQNSDNP